MVTLKETNQEEYIIEGLDDPNYFEEWWQRQPEVYKQGNHKVLAKYRWDKIKQFLKSTRGINNEIP